MALSSLNGISLIGDAIPSATGTAFHAINPTDGAELQPPFHSATAEDIEHAARVAETAFPIFAATSGRDRAAFLRHIADALTTEGATIIERANLETGLPLPRLQGELARTTGQLRLFAEVVEEGSWVDARIDEADRERKPLPRPDIRSMLRPLGPVAIFGASNFPLAFSVAGGDTASALAAGNPVIVKAHPAHPGTSEFVARIIQTAVKDSGLPSGVFALLFDAGIEVGTALVQHSTIKAVAFTGSATGGQALMRLASSRPEPIPCYAEMGSTNPVFLLPGAMHERGDAIAQGLQTSFTLGSGQFCTKPGMVFVPQRESESFLAGFKLGVEKLDRQNLLTHGIAAKYAKDVQQRLDKGRAKLFTAAQPASEPATTAASSVPAVFEIALADFLVHPDLADEIFGPTTLLVYYGSANDLLEAAEKLHGHLTATIHATNDDLPKARELAQILETKVGRILFNGYPTGVEVSHAMVHGGPFPATSDGRSTSVGTRAILRFARLVCYQDFPDSVLPTELQRANPLKVMRLLNGSLTRDAQS